jgi:prepilin-type N-terminal cleavage/methylation domain-containing protein
MEKLMKRAFTLVEVLVVILIVIIVAGLLYPVFFKARARAKQVVCESNLHQIYLGIEMYAQDHDALPAISNADPEWYKRYTGGIELKCPEAVKASQPQSYYIYAGPLPDRATNDASKHFSDLIEECKQIRGSDYPYAWDDNHRTNVDGYQGNGRRMIVVRASGSVQNVPYKDYGDWMPCSRELFLGFQH